MHLRIFLEELTTSYGQPQLPNNGDRFTHRWSVTQQPSWLPIHLCVEVDEHGGRATIWVFDPKNEPVSFNVNGEHDVQPVLRAVKQRVPVAGR